jgi:two-component system, cell cycle sensor histidine kinase and response regulator CckA
MAPDLATLLLLRLMLEVLIAFAFLALMRRYPAIGGPGWWSLGSLLGILGSLALMLRVSGLSPHVASLAGVLMFGANAFAWLGLRSYLRWALPLKVLGLLSMALTAALLLAAFWRPEQPALQQVLYVGASLVLLLLVLRDLVRLGLRRSPPEFRALTVLSVCEGLVMVTMLVWMVRYRSSLDSVASTFLMLFLLTKLVRVMIFGALVSLRLRQEAEQARQVMAEREAQSHELVDHLGAGVVVFRPDRSVLRINAAARRFLGWPETGSLPRSMAWRLLRDDGQPMARHEVPFERVLATGQPVSDFVGGIRIGDEQRWALCNAYPENDALGGLRHVVFTFVDITAMRQMQQQQRALELQLAQSQKMEALGTLAGGVAHDFNNILAAILGNADLARQDLAPAAPARQSLHEISSAARRGRELVRQILAFSRQQPLARTPVCPAAIVEETCSLLRTAVTPNVQLIREVAPQGPAILGDPTRLGQVLLNLGTNAVHALQGRPGRVAFRVDAVGPDDPALPPEMKERCRAAGLGAVRIAVRDDGCGMDEATRARIFEPFFTTKGVGRGTGLGLSMVLGIVEAHGGAITVDSQRDQGTTFTLFFPATREKPPEPEPDSGLAPLDDGTMVAITSGEPPSPDPVSVESPVMSDTASPVPAHILYLDDDDTLVFLVRRLLERRGYKVTAVCDQQEAIDAVRSQPQGFQLLMTDYNMPGMSGIDVAREVLAINPALPVAVASGYISDELQAEAAAAGVTEVVFKTDAVEAFCEIVARLVKPAA